MTVSAASDPLDSTATSASTLSNWVAPYVSDLLGRTQALSGQGFTPFTGQRTAGTSPLQQQAFGQYSGMKIPDQFGIASNYAQQLMAKTGQTRSFTDPGIASLYMSPYQQQVIDINKREAGRQAQMAGQADAARAVGQGAFGGSRYGLVEAENQRNLQQRMGDIQDKGMQDAFNTGRSQFNSEEQQRLQSLLAGSGLASLMGNLGANQGNLNVSQLNAMLNAGNTQQTTEQKGLDADYNDYLMQMKWPYQQLQFQQNMLQGLPLATSVANTQYAPPSTASQLTGGMTAGAGLASILADNYGKQSGG